MKFKVGDKVKTIFEIGTVVDIIYGDNHCWFFEEDELELVNEKNTELTFIGIDRSAEYKPMPIKFNIMPDRYIINKGATVLFWTDGTKTIVKKAKKDKYDKRIGFLTAYFQKMSGMSKTKANKYLDSLVEKDKEIKEMPKKSVKVRKKLLKDDTIIEKIEPLDKNGLQEFTKALNSKYKVGDKVKIINTGSLYTGYASWFEENNCKELAKYFDLRHSPDTTKIF